MAFDPTTARPVGAAAPVAPEGRPKPKFDATTAVPESFARPKPQAAPADTSPRVSDLPVDFAGSAVGAVGSTLRGGGEMARLTAKPIVSAVNEIAGSDVLPEPTNPFDRPAAAIESGGRAISESTSQGYRDQVQATTPTGEIQSPSTWGTEGDPTLLGAAGHVARGLGSVAPMLAGTALTGGGGALAQLGTSTAMAGAQSGGAAAQQEQERISQMPQAQLDTLPAYQELIRGGLDPAAARTQLATETGRSAFNTTAPVGALTGVIMGGPMTRPVQNVLQTAIGGGRMRTALVEGGLEAVTEGAQEVAENAATIAGANMETGETRDVMQDSLANFALGAATGGVVGAGTGLMSRPQPEVEHFPGAPGGTLSDAANAIQRPQPSVNSDASAAGDTPPPTAPGMPTGLVTPATPDAPLGSLTDAVKSMAPAPEIAPPPWLDKTTGVLSAPSEEQLAEHMLGMMQANRDAGQSMRISTKALERAWGVDGKQIRKAHAVALENLGKPAEKAETAAPTSAEPSPAAAEPPVGDPNSPIERAIAQMEAAKADLLKGKTNASEAAPDVQDAQQGRVAVVDPAERAQDGTEPESAVLRQPGEEGGAAPIEEGGQARSDEQVLAAQPEPINAATEALPNDEGGPAGAAVDEGAAPADAAAPPAPVAVAPRNDDQLAPRRGDVASADEADNVLGLPGASAEPAGVSADLQREELRGDGDRPGLTPPPADTLDAAAHAAATSPLNDRPEPTQAQKEAGNYAKGHVKVNGLDVSIENPAGTRRRPEWPELKSHYGYIKRTLGADGDHVDAFVGPHADNADYPVVVINQNNANGEFDEHKVMLGFSSEKQARAAYLANYTKGWKGLGSARVFTQDGFKAWLRDGDTTKPAMPDAVEPAAPAADLATVEHVTGKGKTLTGFVLKVSKDEAKAIDPYTFAKDGGFFVRDKYADQVRAQTKTGGAPATEGATRASNDVRNQRLGPSEGDTVGSGPQLDDAPRAQKPEGDAAPATVREEPGEGQAGAPQLRPVTPAPARAVKFENDDFGNWSVPDGTVLRTASGRAMAPSPKWSTSSPRARTMSLQRQRAWLRDEAIKEAEAGGLANGVNTGMLRSINPNNFSQSDHSTLHLALFGDADGPSSSNFADEPAPKPGSRVTNPDGSYYTAPKAAKPAAKAAIEARDAARANYFAPGNIVRGYGQTFDEVLAYSPPTATGSWSVKVHEVREVAPNKWERIGKPQDARSHSTEPSEKDIQRGPVTRAPAPATAAPKAAPEVSKNTIVTDEAAERARAIIRAKLGQLNAGVDPELLQAGIQLATYHIERGARTFAAYSKAMLDDLGETIRPYLKSWYMGAKFDPNLAGIEGMDSAAAVEAASDAAPKPAKPVAAKPHANATAPEHVEPTTGVSVAELKEMAAGWRSYVDGGGDADVTHVFDSPKKAEIVRLADKAKVYHAEHGWMTVKEAKAKIDEWEANALAQGRDPKMRAINGDKIVLSLFDITGEWSRPWEQAGYQVFRFDIQDESTYEDPETGEERKIGDVNNMSVGFFNDVFGSFDGKDVHAILAACPCTDFAVSGARHFAAKDADGRTVASVELVKQTLAAIEYFKPATWALENPVGRIESLTGLPPWRLSFDPNHVGDPYTKKTLIWGRFNADLPVAPVEPTEGSKMHRLYGGKSMATKNARGATPEGFAYAFFQANNAIDHPLLAIAGKYDRLDADVIQRALDAGLTPAQIDDAVDDHYYMELDDEAATAALEAAIAEASPEPVATQSAQADTARKENDDDSPDASGTDTLDQPVAEGPQPEDARRGAAHARDSDGRRDDPGLRGEGGRSEIGPDVERDMGGRVGDGLVPDGADGALAGSDGGTPAHDFRARAADLARTGSWADTAERNIDLIDLALRIEAENRPATAEEQAQLAKYVGFGAGEIRNNLFPVVQRWVRDANPGKLIYPEQVQGRWRPLAERLAKLPKAWQESVLQSTQYAHYTSPNIINSMWSAFERLGFTGGRILEPGAGIGSFPMLMPDHVRTSSKYTGIEFDGPTALIARLLSPEQRMLHDDFIKRRFPRDYFDVAIGNPPFSATKILGDPEYAKNGFMLHDFFFAKSLDRVRPGGLLAFVTSKGTMDKQSDKARKFMADRADLLGAIRLPSTAFEGNAGTSVVTDVIFLRKRMPGEEPAGQPWRNLATVETPEGPTPINEYFAANPDMVLGQNRISGGVDDVGRRINSNGRGGQQYTVVSYDKTPAELDAKFAAAVQKLPTNVYSITAATPEQARAETTKADFDPGMRREGVVYVDKDGDLMRVQDGVGVPLTSVATGITAKDVAWFKSYIGVRELVQEARLAQASDGDWQKALKRLNKAYDAFREAHGPVNAFRTQARKSVDEEGNTVETEIRVFTNRRRFREDYDSSIVTQLETINEAGEVVKSKFLEGRTIEKPKAPEIKSVGDAVAVTLDRLGRLDVDEIAHALGVTREEAIDTLGPQIYQTPQGEWQMADEYLSGDVVAKLADAIEAARDNPELERNVAALTDVQPEKLGPSQISVKLGAAWVPAEVMNEFAKEIGAGAVTQDIITESYQVEGGNKRTERKAAAEYGTADRSTSELLEAALNSRAVTVKKKDDQKKEYTDQEATTAANAVIAKMQEKFRSWVWTDGERATELVETYNRRFNNIAPRRFNGDHLTLPGVSTRFKPHPHQKRAIWRQIQDGNTYLAHAVGAGKTFEMIAGGMEQKRLGLINKPIYAVPNHMLEQFANEFMEFYPLANVMVADDENFSAERRRAFIANATLNAPDAIIITHSAFERIGVKEETVAPLRDDMLATLQNELDDAEGDDSRVKRSQLQQQIESLTQRFERIVGAGGKDSTIKFEDIGADFVYVDEAHAFRKLDFTTNRSVKGIDPKGSRRALDMYVKTRYLESQRPGRSMVFASGTPVTNTMGELYTQMKFFAGDELERAGISTFDSWARMFGEARTELEMNAAGRYENVERFSKFENVPELMSRVRQFMDVLTSESLGSLVKRPEIEGGKPNLVLVPPTKAMREYKEKELGPRLIRSRKWKPSRLEPFNPDPVIAITTDGRFSALDPRFFGGVIEEGESTKLTVMADAIAAEYRATAKNGYVTKDKKPDAVKGGTQIVFYNLGFGAGAKTNRGFDARADLIARLTKAGVKRDHIAFFDDANTDAKKEAVFKAMRAGQIRVLVGSAKKMGTGVNVQNRLTMLHYLDPPWFPSDVEQPHGRILRQGNQNESARINWYATEETYDSTMWQMVGRKQRFIDQAFSGDKSLRTMEDMSEASAFEMAAAMASGDPRAMQLAGLKQDVERYERQQAAHASEQVRASYALRDAEYTLKSSTARVATYEAAIKAMGTPYLATWTGKTAEGTTDRPGEFGAMLKTAVNKAIGKLEKSPSSEAVEVGTIHGLPIEIQQDSMKASDGRRMPSGSYELTVQVGSYTAEVATVPAAGMDDKVDAVGLARRVVNRLNEIDTHLRASRTSVTEAETDIVKLRKKVAAPFEHEQALNEKVAALATLENDLRIEGEVAAARDAANAAPLVITEDGEVNLDLGADQTGTPEFKRWFGDSKVVDAKGNPLVVYHGTALEKNTFRRSGGGAGVGAYFSPDPAMASEYASMDAEVDGEPPHVMPVYLSLKNPKVMRGTESFGVSVATRDALEAEGFDGIFNPDAPEYIAFHPEQIKSAVGNTGAFDPANPRIDMDMGPAAPVANATPLGRAVHSALQATIEPLRAIGVDVTIVDSPEQLPEGMKKRHPQQYKRIRGAVASNGAGKPTKVWIVASNVKTIAQAKRTLLHEVLGHWGMERYLGEDFRAVANDALRLVRTDPSLATIHQRVLVYKDRGEATMAKEALAMLAESDVNNGLIARIAAAMRALARAIGLGDVHLSKDEIRALIRKAAKSMDRAVRDNATTPAEGAFSLDLDLIEGDPEPDPPSRHSFDLEGPPAPSADAVLDGFKNPDANAYAALKSTAAGRWRDLQPKLLALLQLRHLTELGEKLMPGIGAYSDLNQRMSADRNQLLEGLGEKAQAWRDWAALPGARGWFGKQKPEAHTLNTLIHDTTLKGVDPSRPYESLTFRDSANQVVTWSRQGVAARIKEIRGQMRGRPGDSKSDMMDEIKWLRGLERRENERKAAYPGLLARWQRLTPGAQAIYTTARDHYEQHSKDVESALINRIKALKVPETYKRAMTDKIRLQFETQRVEGVYFPLNREGDYWLDSTSPDGRQVYLMFESYKEFKAAVAQLRGGGYTINASGRRDTETRAKDAPSGTFVAEIIQQMQKAGAPEKAQDEVYQLYLKTLPEMSMRKHSIHRKGIAGYSGDAMRAFAKSGFHGAHQLSKLRFGHLLEATVEALQAGVDNRRRNGNPEEATAADAILGELRKRHDWIMSPKDSQLANMASSIGFIYYLGVTPAAAIVNLTQGAQVTFPVLGAKYGAGKAGRFLAAATRDAVRTWGNIQTTLVDEEEKRAYAVLRERGDIEKTQAHMTAGIAEGDALRMNPTYAKVMNGVSYLFSRMEIINREAAGLAAYRLARAGSEGVAPMSFDGAVQYASDIINGTHFDYSNANRARFMQGNVAKVLLQFRSYSLSMSWMLGRNVYQAFKGESPETRRMARRTLGGMLGMTALFSGMMGLPMMGMAGWVAGALHAAFGDDDEPYDFQVEFRAWLKEHLPTTPAEILADGVVNQTGANVADRVKLSDLWFRDADRELEGRDLYYHLLEQATGPMGGIAKNLLVGKQQMEEGHVWRGFETMMPKFVKDGMKTIRFGTEGANTLRGDPLIEDVTTSEKFIQALGFAPTRLAEQYRTNRATKNYEQHILNTRSSLLNAFALATRIGDTEMRAATVQRIQAFNRKFPELTLNAESIRKSLQARARYSAQAEGGVVINRKIAERIRDQVGGGEGKREPDRD